MKDTPTVSDEGCLQRSKEAAGVTVYLMEELGDARLRCEQLVRYLHEAGKLIEKSSHRDHFFEVAGHLIQSVPVAAFKLQKSLNAVALAAGRLDYEELKQDLRPGKVQELEKVLDEVRIRQVQRRSDPMWQQLTPKLAAEELRRLAQLSREAGGVLPVHALAQLIADLEGPPAKEASEAVLADQLETVAASLETPGDAPSAKVLAGVLRRMLGDTHIAESNKDMTTMDQAWKIATDEKQTRFEEGKPADPTKDMSPEEAKEWKANTEKHRDKFKKDKSATEWKAPATKSAAINRGDVQSMARHIGEVIVSQLQAAANSGQMKQAVTKAVVKYQQVFARKGVQLRDPVAVAEDVLYMALDVSKAEPNWDKIGDVVAEYLHDPEMSREATDEKQTRFEEGKPADPTKDMSKEQKAEWEKQKQLHKDEFKASWKKEALKGSWSRAKQSARLLKAASLGMLGAVEDEDISGAANHGRAVAIRLGETLGALGNASAKRLFLTAADKFWSTATFVGMEPDEGGEQSMLASSDPWKAPTK